MKRTLRLLAAVTFAAIIAMAAEPVKERHLEIVKWDLTTKKLVAVVSEGRVVPATHEAQPDGTTATTAEKYIAERLIDYEIDLRSGTLTCEGESEQFSRYEGELIWRVVDLLVQYAGESVMWFESTHESKPKREAKR